MRIFCVINEIYCYSIFISVSGNGKRSPGCISCFWEIRHYSLAIGLKLEESPGSYGIWLPNTSSCKRKRPVISRIEGACTVGKGIVSIICFRQCQIKKHTCHWLTIQDLKHYISCAVLIIIFIIKKVRCFCATKIYYFVCCKSRILRIIDFPTSKLQYFERFV